MKPGRLWITGWETPRGPVPNQDHLWTQAQIEAMTPKRRKRLGLRLRRR